MNHIKTFSKEVGIAGVLGVAYIAMKSKKNTKSDPLLDHTKYLKKSPLASHVLELRDLRCDTDWSCLINECEDLIVLTSTNTVSGGQFLANRKTYSIGTLCKRMCDEAKRSGDAERIDASIHALRDHIPQIQDIISTYLQNMLL